MDKLFENCLESPMTVCIYFACVLLLLVLCVYHLNKLSKPKEHYTGYGLGQGGGYGGVTSGATQRTIAQELSATNQQANSVLSNAEVAILAPELSQVGRPVDIFSQSERPEYLVNGRGDPDFWEIGNELAAYKQSQTPGMKADAAAKAERFRGRREHLDVSNPIRNAEDDALGTYLWMNH